MNQPAPFINARFQGVCFISATPFTDEGALDLSSVDSLTDFYLDKGASGLTILGVMGEAAKLTDEESLAMVRRVLARVCRLHAAGRAAEAEDVYDAYLLLLCHEFQYGVGLALRKEVLRRRSVIRSAFVRKPGPVLDAADHADLLWLMDRLEARIELLPQVPPYS